MHTCMYMHVRGHTHTHTHTHKHIHTPTLRYLSVSRQNVFLKKILLAQCKRDKSDETIKYTNISVYYKCYGNMFIDYKEFKTYKRIKKYESYLNIKFGLKKLTIL